MPKTTAKKATAKKAVKKAAVKKTVAKKAVKKTAKKATKKTAAKNKAATKRNLVYAADHESFWTTDGQVLNSLLALRDALSEMEKEVYLYHTSGTQNDFAVWVEKVLSDGTCAVDLAKAHTPSSAKTVVVRHLKLYNV